MKNFQVMVVVLLGLLGCASQTKLPEPVRAAVQHKHEHRIVELRQSCYYGDLYDENERWLLSPYPFNATSHINTPEGAPIHPRVQRGLIPAGTKLVVDQVEFPDAWGMARRTVLTTPRFNPWIYLRAAPDEPHVPPQAKLLVWVLPADLPTEEAVETAIGKALAPDNEVSAWLGQVRPTVRVAIEHKEIIDGMTLPELTASMGDPWRWFIEQKDGHRATVAWYPEHEAWLVNDKVVEVRPSRTLAPTPDAHMEPQLKPIPVPASQP